MPRSCSAYAALCLSLVGTLALAQGPAARPLDPAALPAGLAALANGTMAGRVAALEATTAAYRLLPVGDDGPAHLDGDQAQQRLSEWLARPDGDHPSLPATFLLAQGDRLGHMLASLTLGPTGRRVFLDQGWPVMVTKDGKEISLVVNGVYAPALSRATESVALAAHLARVARSEWLPGLSQMATCDLAPGVTHVGYMAVWPAGNSLLPDGPPVLETGTLIAPVIDVQRYVRGDLTDADLLRLSRAYVCDRDHDRLRKTEIRLAD